MRSDLRGLAARAVALLAACVALVTPGWARAHEVGVSKGTYVLQGATLTAEIVFSRRELSGLVDGLDPNRDGEITPSEVAGAEAAVTRAIADAIEVRGDGGGCGRAGASVRLDEVDGIAVVADYRCASRPARIAMDIGFLEELAHGHRHLVTLTAGTSTVRELASSARRSFALDVFPKPEGAGAEGEGGASEEHAEVLSKGALGFLLLGIEHILLGYDHLVFLLGLVLVGGRWRSLLLVVTAFTVAHSITLALSVLGVWAPSPKLVEPAIALSIAYVGVENYFVKDAEKRWRITFPFGLVHGFGFAGVLQEIAIPASDVPVSLLSFNAGVEIGQLGVMAVLLPLVVAARRQAWFQGPGTKAVSAAVVVAGIAWFFLRVTGLEIS